MAKAERWEFTCPMPDGGTNRFRLDKEATYYELCDADGPINEEGKVFELLEYFLNNAGKLLVRANIQDKFWKRSKDPGDVCAHYLGRLRKLLRDWPGPRLWHIIETLHGNGVRFTGTIVAHVVQDESLPSLAALPTPGLVVGREQEIEIARNRWFENRQRPLLIQGPPGIGKSTLALKILHDPEVEKRFSERRYRLACDDLLKVDDVITSIGRKWFGLTPPVTEMQVVGVLSQKGPCAVLLDNYETLLRGADSEASQEWLADLVGVKDLWLIVGVQGHTRPRGVNWAEPVEPLKLSLGFARELFFKLTHTAWEKDMKDQRLDRILTDDLAGIPHCIEMFGLQARNYPNLEPVIERWDREHLTLLRTGRGESRMENIEESYKFAIESPFLDDDDRSLLRMLAFLPSGIAVDDLDKVMNGGLKAAGALRCAALAYFEGDPYIEGRDRLRMLAPLRQYVLSRHMINEGERQSIIRYYMKLHSDSFPEFIRHNTSHELYRKGIAEHSNILFAAGATFLGGSEEAIEARAQFVRYLLANEFLDIINDIPKSKKQLRPWNEIFSGGYPPPPRRIVK